MKWITFLRQSPDVLVALSLGAVALWLSQFDDLAVLRWLFGFSFVFLGSGYAITRLLPQNASTFDRMIASSLVSLLLTYPAAVITVIAEGQSPQSIFGRHLTHSLSSLYILSFGLTIWISSRVTTLPKFGKFPKIMVIPLAIYALLTLTNLNRADVFGDEYDLGYQAYNLVDGIKAGRKAFTISFSGHPPLVMDIKHFSMNILEPRGLDKLADWQFRMSEALLGLLTIVAAYALIGSIYSKKAAVFGALLLSVNNYMVWMGRIFHREMYMTFFMVASVYFLIRSLKSKNKIYHWLSGLALGVSLLSKESAIVLAAALMSWAVFAKKHRVQVGKVLAIALLLFSPVVIYNVAAYATMGYADVFFSNLLGFQRPGATPIEHDPLRNVLSMGSLLWDINSPAVMLAFTIGLMTFFFRKKSIEEVLALVWIGVALLFFAATAIRSYYFLFLMIPLVLISVRVMGNFPKLIRRSFLGALLVYSFIYAYNTNISRSYSRAEDIGGIDGPIILSHPLKQHYSLAARSWVEEVGYKNLQAVLDGKIGEGDCLITATSMNSLAVRRYIGHEDKIKEHYLGSDYRSRYPRCPADRESVQGTVYFVSKKREAFKDLEAVITDHLGNERFFLFRLDAEDLMT